jgi:hypothetical protein
VAQIQSQTLQREKDATILMKGMQPSGQPSAGTVAAAPAQTKLAPPADPKEVLLLASIPVTDNDLAALAADRARVVRAYLLAAGKVEASRLFLAENQTGSVRSDGSRAYLQFR